MKVLPETEKKNMTKVNFCGYDGQRSRTRTLNQKSWYELKALGFIDRNIHVKYENLTSNASNVMARLKFS